MADSSTNLLIGVNLKMYMGKAQTLSWIDSVIAGIGDVSGKKIDYFLLPSAPLISDSISKTSGTQLKIGAQNISTEDSGSLTGEISPQLLNEIGCVYALIGHHERRSLFGESDEIISQKIQTSLKNRLIPILCIGEISTDANVAKVELKHQIRAALENVQTGESLVIAYEPTWAIGAENPASDGHINAMCLVIREEMAKLKIENFRLIYGGSAGKGLFEKIAPTCDGLFLGRRAHDPLSFLTIVQECKSIREATN